MLYTKRKQYNLLTIPIPMVYSKSDPFCLQLSSEKYVLLKHLRIALKNIESLNNVDPPSLSQCSFCDPLIYLQSPMLMILISRHIKQ